MRWRCSFPSALLLTLLLGWWGQSSGLKICAFKLHNLNSTKASNKRVMFTLKRVVARCDICLLQNVKDPTSSLMNSMVNNLNRDSDSYGDHNYQMLISESLGSQPNNKQQYVFIYRMGMVNVTGTYQSKSKSFVRPPFVVRFQSNQTRVGDFVLVAVHTEPSRAVQEMDQLYEVFKDISGRWNTEMIMFLGNFNAGCGHMSRSNKKHIRLFKKDFYWLIGDNVDTTTTDTTDCPYDRIVVRGKAFLKQIEPYSAQVFNFVKKLHISKAEAMQVSEHLPIEVVLKSSAHLPQATPLLLLSLAAILSSWQSALRLLDCV